MSGLLFRLLLWAALCSGASLEAAEAFRIAQYNIENYLDEPTSTRPVKSEAAKAKVREGILALKPDVIALEEVGGTNALLEMRDSLKLAGLDLPFWEHVTGFDTNIHVAILSRFEITARRPHTNDSFLLSGKRFRVSRGFAEVDVQVSSKYSFTMIVAHLKSRRTIAAADEAELRLEEAKVLREIIDARLAARPTGNLVVLGDFNDSPDSQPIRTILGGRGKKGLIDTRPAERNGDTLEPGDRRLTSRQITWTHFYSKEDAFTRIDYILLNQAMAKAWEPGQTYILTRPDWGLASDHRPLVAGFVVD